ncbi:MAG: hypothetical protein ISR65_02120 [Bacteriovoracaceae bacterium]|nr:hypothetical protein [Bacteriovoracaceae bacterium]
MNKNSNYVNGSDEKSSLIVIASFFVITLLVGAIFHHDKKKINVDKMKMPAQQAKKMRRMAITLKKHIARNTPPQAKLKVKPLIKSLALLHCAMDKKNYVPMCSRCNVPFTKVGVSLHCPVCKQEALFMCPNNIQNKMVLWNVHSHRKRHANATYVCPVCAHSGPPRWDSRGAPRCPYCRNIMKL